MRSGDPEYQVPQWWTWVGAGLILIGLTIRNVIRDEELQAEASKA
jgi:drug/metabolite transporter (DMT)-like permease